MSQPNPATAYIFDHMVRFIDRTLTAKEISLAAQEFALGKQSLTRALDLCWGFCPIITPENNTHAGKELIIGKGVARIAGALLPVTAAETAFNPSSLLGSTALVNTYAFGSWFLVESGGSVSIAINLTGLDNNNLGQPLLMLRDLGVDEVKDWLLQGLVKATIPPSGNVVELGKFLVDITVYMGVNDPRNRVRVLPVDLRLPRGWAGYAEENLAGYLTPKLIQYNNNIKQAIDVIDAETLNLVVRWISSSDWDPTFIGYWQTAGNEMPDYLKHYLAVRLGIII